MEHSGKIDDYSLVRTFYDGYKAIFPHRQLSLMDTFVLFKYPTEYVGKKYDTMLKNVSKVQNVSLFL